MIQINEQDKTFLFDTIRSTFHADDATSAKIVQSIIDALDGNTDELFYEARFNIHFKNDPEYSNKVFLSMFMIYNYFLEQIEEPLEKEELSEFFIRFYKNIFTLTCEEKLNTQRRGEIVQNILKHVTSQLNHMLYTQQLMIGNISHEMRTSLNAIKGYITLVEKENIINGDAKEYMNKASAATDSLEALVTDILDITKINSDQMEIKRAPFWLDEVILHSISNIDLQLQKKQLAFTSKVAFFPYQVVGDAQRIMEILTNLLSNAVKYTNHGFINLTIEAEPQHNNYVDVIFHIKDSGIGMTETEVHNIFDSYTRHIKDVQGLGLGLFISKKLAQKMGGDITVDSKKGKGSTFTFTLTLKQVTDDSVRLDNKLIFFFNDNPEAEVKTLFNQKVGLFKDLGATVKNFDDQETFTKYLLEHKDETDDQPDIISISTNKENYLKYDALINYLKIFPKFSSSYFIAEETQVRLSLNYFNKSFERFSTIFAYIEAIRLNEKKEETGHAQPAKIRILAVDDIETNLEILELFIHQKYPDIIIDKASGGYEAVGMYKVNSYNLIFIDLKMPGLDGFEVIKKFKSIKATPPTYALTADVYKDTYDKVDKAGFNGLLEKPLKLDNLYQMIEDMIDV